MRPDMPLPARRLSVPAIAACATHAPPPPPPSPCAITACRPAKTIILQEGKGQHIINAVPAPYVNQGVVIVRPSDDFFIAADERDGGLVNLRRVDPPGEGAPNVIHITYKQDQLNNGAFVMMLLLQSSFARTLVYHAAGMRAGRTAEQVFATSTCPLMPGIVASEMWPVPVWQLFLKNFRFSDGAVTCQVY